MSKLKWVNASQVSWEYVVVMKSSTDEQWTSPFTVADPVQWTSACAMPQPCPIRLYSTFMLAISYLNVCCLKLFSWDIY